MILNEWEVYCCSDPGSRPSRGFGDGTFSPLPHSSDVHLVLLYAWIGLGRKVGGGLQRTRADVTASHSWWGRMTAQQVNRSGSSSGAVGGSHCDHHRHCRCCGCHGRPIDDPHWWQRERRASAQTATAPRISSAHCSTSYGSTQNDGGIWRGKGTPPWEILKRVAKMIYIYGQHSLAHSTITHAYHHIHSFLGGD
jgi:hypothetical protein